MKRIVKLKKQENETLSAQFESFINDCIVRGMSKDTIASYKSQINLFVNFTGDREVNTTLINDYVLHMRAKGNNDQTIRSKIKFVRTFLNHCGYEDSIKYPIISVNRSAKEPYTSDEIKALIKPPTRNAYTDWRNHAIVCTFLATGMRLNTLVNLRCYDVDFKNNTIHLRVTKTHKDYYIPLSSDLKATLKNYLSLFEHDEEDYLFMSMYGDKLSRPSLKEAIRTYNQKRGVTRGSVHLYRNTFAVNFLKNGGNLFTLKEILGHTDISVTQQYLKFTVEDLQTNFDDFCPLDSCKRKGIKIKK